MTKMCDVNNIKNMGYAIAQRWEGKGNPKSEQGEVEIANVDFSKDTYRYSNGTFTHYHKTNFDGTITNVYDKKTEGNSIHESYDEDNDGTPEYYTSYKNDKESNTIMETMYDDGYFDTIYTELRDDGQVDFTKHSYGYEDSKWTSIIEKNYYDEQGRIIKKTIDNEDNNGKSWFSKAIGTIFAPKSSKDTTITYKYDEKTGQVKTKTRYGYIN